MAFLCDPFYCDHSVADVKIFLKKRLNPNRRRISVFCTYTLPLHSIICSNRCLKDVMKLILENPYGVKANPNEIITNETIMICNFLIKITSKSLLMRACEQWEFWKERLERKDVEKKYEMQYYSTRPQYLNVRQSIKNSINKINLLIEYGATWTDEDLQKCSALNNYMNVLKMQNFEVIMRIARKGRY